MWIHVIIFVILSIFVSAGFIHDEYIFLVKYYIHFRFKGIPATEPSNFVFDWNPCTKVSEGSGCKDMLVSAITLRRLLPYPNPK